ncbi:hypothetical protein PsorP6_006903 [Peronosclerospora sorghi]|uniref:Uncharacterized protein n=1 Tax=Peronosclerospora sorghi TaxID=230839 RepID=A0ACC0W7A5_9STRA|nr:hypothetical protein PsorP6_006903 [Peronosclerospora sorghi]
MMDKKDLYDGLELPQKTKREREEEEKNKKTAINSASKDEAKKRQRVDQKPLDLPATVSKLERHMMVDKKFPKASKLFCQLITDQLTAESSELFLQTLTKLIDKKGETLSGRKEFQTLIETLISKANVILSIDGDGRTNRERKLTEWKFLAITHAQLFTDETYQFNKAAKVVKLRFEELVERNKAQNEKDQAQQLHTQLMPLLRTLYRKLSVTWATSIVEGVLALATRNRLLFDEHDRREIDMWSKSMKDRRSAPATSRSAGSDARRNIVPINKNSISEAGASVPGRLNHPLFNKDL